MNWNNEINDIIREALQILKRRQEAAQQQADIERLKAENERLREEARVRSLILDGFVGPVPTSDEWRMMCSKANELKAALRQEV